MGAAPESDDEDDLAGSGGSPEKSSVPHPFKLTDRAVLCLDDDSKKHQTLCSYLEVVGMTRNANGNAWGRLHRMRDVDGNIKEWAMPMELLAGNGDDLPRILLGMGLILAPGTKARNKLYQYISTCRPDERIRCVIRIGWHDKVYVLPDESFGDPGKERVLLQTIGPVEHAFRQKGTLEDWQKNVAQYAVGNSRLAFSLSTAFAAPLLHVLDEESGGFHFRGGSSIGKTTALKVAGSACGGGGIMGYIKQWRSTDNALDATAQTHCDSLLCLDELSQIDGKAADACTYMLANGAGKSDAGRSGEARPTTKWRSLFLSTGEIGIADKVAEDGRGRKATAGQEVRVVDIPAKATAEHGLFENLHGFKDGDAVSQYLTQAAAKCYGTAIRKFLAKLVKNIDGDFENLRKAMRGFIDEFMEKYLPPSPDG